jgi:putative cell wall-binding protein
MASRRPPLVLTAGLGALLLVGGVAAPASAVPDGVQRIGGADRFEVSAAISNDIFPAGFRPPAAYVVSGETFADALSASALAGLRGGPVLLTTRAALPPSVRSELERLDPERIVLLGGESAVSDAVYRELRKVTPVVERIGGADRFEVSASAARSFFGVVPAATAFVASGENFPDALSGAAAAAHLGGAVLLTRRESLPAAVRAELLLEGPKSIAVVGGPSAVSPGVITELTGSVQPETRRITGGDRFEVSAAISVDAFRVSSTVYIASGEAFPDALSGSAAAARVEAPVLLVTKSSIPAPVAAELRRLKPSKIVILGGTAAIGTSVENELRGFLAP